MDLKRCKIINLIHDAFEDLELWYPTLRLQEEGITVHLVGESRGVTYRGKHGVPAVADFSFSEVRATDYDGLLVPGGWAPDKLRRFPECLALVRAMDQAGKPIGQICHGGWVLIEADVVRGRTVTSYPSLRTDFRNAGATWVDEQVHVDHGIVSSRRPDDLPAFCDKLVEEIAEGRHQARRAA